jgi:hypothetical protein
MQCICIDIKSSIDQVGEVDMAADDLRRVSGLAGLTGAGFFVGDIERDVFVGDLDPDDGGLTLD